MDGALARIMLEKEKTGVKFAFEITSLGEVLDIMNETKASGDCAPLIIGSKVPGYARRLA